MSNFKNYDQWKLDNPYDDDQEYFESELPVYISNNEALLTAFEEEVKELAESYNLKEL